jgi:hypothetical protein
MEEISLTPGQFQILLNMTSSPESRHVGPTADLVGPLHRAHNSGHKWRVKMTEQDIGIALALFRTHQQRVRTPAAQQALRTFVNDNATAKRLYYALREQSNVPRETSESAGE